MYHSNLLDKNSKPNKYTFTPTTKKLELRVWANVTVDNIKDLILNKNTFPNWTTITFDTTVLNNITSTKGTKTINVTVTYPDWSSNTVNLELIVWETLWSSPNRNSLRVANDSRVKTWNEVENTSKQENTQKTKEEKLETKQGKETKQEKWDDTKYNLRL